MSEFRCPMSVIWCPMYDVHCLLSDVRCLMSDVKYIYFPLSSDFRFLVHLLEIRSLLRMTLSFLRALTWICMPEKSGIRFVLCSAIIMKDCIYEHIRCGMLHRQSSVKIIFYFWFCPFVWLLMYHWGQVKKNNSKQTNVSRPDFYKKESGRRVFFFPVIFVFLLLPIECFLDKLLLPPWKSKRLNTNLVYFDTCFKTAWSGVIRYISIGRVQWADSGCHWRPSMLTPEVTVNMLMYNV